MFLASGIVNLNWGFFALPDVNFISTVCSVLSRAPKMKKLFRRSCQEGQKIPNLNLLFLTQVTSLTN